MNNQIENQLVECPECGAASDSIKVYKKGYFLFLILAWSLNMQPYIACPHCQRKNIGKYLLINILTAHLLYIIPLIWFGVNFFKSYTFGHSSEVIMLLKSNQE